MVQKVERPLNFDILRLVLSLIVMLVHVGINLSDYAIFLSGSMAIKFFFCISGFLITASYLNSPDIKTYLEKRIRRIYPPIVSTAIFIFILGLIFKYNLSFFISIPSLLLFQDWTPLQAAPIYSHGAFWTLVIEFQFYLLLPFIVFGLKRYKWATLLLLCILYQFAIYANIEYERIETENRELANMLRQNIFLFFNFFISGIILAFFYEKIKSYWMPLFIIGLMIFLLNFYHPSKLSLELFALAVALVMFGIAKLSGYLGKRIFFGDLSYGIYIYHFPVIFLLEKIGAKSSVNVIALTCLFAFTSWHLVENKLISYKKRVQL